MSASEIPLDGSLAETPDPAIDEGQPRRRRKAIILLLLLGLLIGLLILAIWYLLFRQPIIAPLPGISDTALPHYTSSIYGVDGPVGVAVSSSGDRVYVTQTGGQPGVLIFDADGNGVGTFETPSGSVHAPVYLAIDPLTQEIYVSDRMAGAIYVYDTAGKLLRQYEPTSAIPAWQPLGLAFDTAGNLFVTDFSGTTQKVEVFDRTGALVRTLGADSGLSFPNGVSVDAAGNAWVTDSSNGRLLVFDQAGKVIAQVGRGVGEGNLGLPRGVVVAGERVFVADNTAHGVFAYRPLSAGEGSPSFVGFLGGEGRAEGQFEFPNGITVDGRGRMYVADLANNRVQVWSY
jgi:DNA-binding beta-propeller fold protein YncE